MNLTTILYKYLLNLWVFNNFNLNEPIHFIHNKIKKDKPI